METLLTVQGKTVGLVRGVHVGMRILGEDLERAERAAVDEHGLCAGHEETMRSAMESRSDRTPFMALQTYSGSISIETTSRVGSSGPFSWIVLRLT